MSDSLNKIQLLEELNKRNIKAIGKSEFWLTPQLTEKQQVFIKNPKRFKLVRASRQSGKTFTLLQYLLYKALNKSRARCLLIGLTRPNVKELGWDTLKYLIETNNIPCRMYEAELKIVFPNSSVIKLVAAELDLTAKRLRGGTYDLVAVDECAFSSQADNLIKIIMPTLAVRKGTIVMASSPGACSGFFYEADTGTKGEWSTYRWYMTDNPAITNAEEELDLIAKTQYNGDRSNPMFRREYMGEWVRDNSVLLFHYDKDKNLVTKNEIPTKNMEYICALDLGWNDANALVVIGYNPSQRFIYFVEVWKQAKIHIDELAEVCRIFIDKYNPKRFTADFSAYGKGICEELKMKHKIPVLPAIKRDKISGIMSMNSDFYSGYIKVSSDLGQLIEEWSVVERDPNTGIERKSQACDLADASLYAWREVHTSLQEQNIVKLSVQEEMKNRAMQRNANSNHEEGFGDISHDNDFARLENLY